MPRYHEPVMVGEVLSFLQPQGGQTFIDCTVGGGGHALEIVKRILPDGRLIGLDRDEEAISAAAEYLSPYRENVILEKGSFGDLQEIAGQLGIGTIDGALFDLGVSSHQLESPERGFSFRYDAELDMRMDRSQAVTARELVNSLSERRLAELIRTYGEDRWAKRIAKFIVDRRARKPIRTTFELVQVILAAVPEGARTEHIHPATRTFQALRIAVNREMESLQEGLDAAIGLLSTSGRICVLSYHSLEDRIVKDTFARHAGRCQCPPGLPVCACGAKKNIRILTKRPLLPEESEVRAYPRSRSAKLRAAEKLGS
ncbi:MAG: 16S rRNA (cytosine(1402)-N(4))-methyltransferase RsmH [Armatimonadetes bacterium]|nr:16S rRNA (cytosine(1402)-N(4))-methyltransferase RsmH [Armatimonadota bacterium]